MAPPSAILDLINKVYGQLRQGAELRRKKDEDDERVWRRGGARRHARCTDEAPIIRWVNSLLFQAVKERASDIHIEPGEKEVKVRYRVDGALRESSAPPNSFCRRSWPA